MLGSADVPIMSISIVSLELLCSNIDWLDALEPGLQSVTGGHVHMYISFGYIYRHIRAFSFCAGACIGMQLQLNIVYADCAAYWRCDMPQHLWYDVYYMGQQIVLGCKSGDCIQLAIAAAAACPQGNSAVIASEHFGSKHLKVKASLYMEHCTAGMQYFMSCALTICTDALPYATSRIGDCTCACICQYFMAPL